MKTGKLNFELVLKTRKIVTLTKQLGGKNFEEVYFKMQNERNLEQLTSVIYTLAENEEGKNPFKSSLEVYDFLDDYKKESNKSYDDIFKEIAEVINDEGFFNRKMSKKELEEKMNDIMGIIDMESILKNTAEKVIADVAKEEFTGYRG